MNASKLSGARNISSKYNRVGFKQTPSGFNSLGTTLERTFTTDIAMTGKESNSSESEGQSSLHEKIHDHVYGILLLILMALLTICASIATTKIGLILSDLLFVGIVFLVANTTFRQQKTLYNSFMLWSVIAASLDISAVYAKPELLSTILECSSGTFYAGILITSIVLLTERLSRTTKTTLDTVLGGICVYLLLAFLWYVAYDLLQLLDPTAFSFAFKRNGEYDLMYFSINTLTTLGHGDIVPMNRAAMVLCNIEAIVGQIFPAVFIAKLVSMHVSDAQQHSEEAEQFALDSADRSAS